MLEIVVDSPRSTGLRQAIVEAIESGEYETLHDDIRDSFSEDQITAIEEFLDGTDIDEAIDEVVTEWGGDDLDDLIENLVTYFAQYSMELQILDGDQFEEEDTLVEDDIEANDNEFEEGSEEEEEEEDEEFEDEL